MNESDIERYLAHCEEIIKRAGWMVQGVFPTEESTEPSFAYTIGLHDQGVPELLTFSLPPHIAQALLNDLGRHLLTAKLTNQPLTGKVVHDNWGTPFYLLPAKQSVAAEYATGAMRRSNDKAAVLQVVWPDRGGAFPWESSALLNAQHLQPVLYATPAP